MSNNVYPSGAYGDPSNMVDSLRRAERHVADSCDGCRHSMGKLWGQEVCRENKKRDEDGFCFLMDKGRG